MDGIFRSVVIGNTILHPARKILQAFNNGFMHGKGSFPIKFGVSFGFVLEMESNPFGPYKSTDIWFHDLFFIYCFSLLLKTLLSGENSLPLGF